MIRNTALIVIAFGAIASAAAPSPAIIVGAELTAEGSVDGHPARFQLIPDGTSTLILNPEAAARFGFTGGMFGARARVGRVNIEGNTKVTRFAVAGRETSHRIPWFARPVAPGFDGAIGPGAVPQPVVTFNLHAPAAGERRIVLPLVDKGYGGMGTQIVVAGQPIFVEWRLTKRTNGATAAAAAAIAPVYDGQFTGKPWSETLAFGIERPVRRLSLARPVQVGPFSLTELVTRTADYGDVSAIPDADADMSEIVVNAKSKAKGTYTIQIGADALAGCSSLTFDKPHRQVVLACR